MKNRINPPAVILSALLLTSIGILCAACGALRSGAPPTPTEAKFFNITTNYVPVVQPVTNFVPVTEYKTNVVTVTNSVGLTQYTTNVVPVTVTNVSVVNQTNLQPEYNWAPGPGVQQAKDTVGAVGNLFGVGGLASTAVTLLAGIWGWWRSSRNAATAANTTQVVETLREFIKQLPNGSAYDTALVQWMTEHQAQAGVLNNVISVLASEVSNSDAKFAAQSVTATLQGLGIQVPVQTTATVTQPLTPPPPTATGTAKV